MKKLIFAIMLCSGGLAAQDTIRLKNASFELGKANCEEIPDVWKYVGSKSYGADLWQPKCSALKTEAQHGKRYIGLTVRSDRSRQAIMQVFREGDRMEKGKEYGFDLFLAKSKVFWAVDAKTSDSKLCDRAVVLRIWGTNKKRSKREQLAESLVVQSETWEQFSFLLAPKEMDCTAIELEAYFENSGDEAYNGHVLIDNLQPIFRMRDTDLKKTYQVFEPKSQTHKAKKQQKMKLNIQGFPQKPVDKTPQGSTPDASKKEATTVQKQSNGLKTNNLQIL